MCTKIIRATPSEKNGFFFFFFFFFFCIKISLCQNDIVLCVEMAEIFVFLSEGWKNDKIKNRATSCFKLAQIMPRVNLSWCWNIWWLRKVCTHTYTQTRFMFISIARFDRVRHAHWHWTLVSGHHKQSNLLTNSFVLRQGHHGISIFADRELDKSWNQANPSAYCHGMESISWRVNMYRGFNWDYWGMKTIGKWG